MAWGLTVRLMVMVLLVGEAAGSVMVMVAE